MYTFAILALLALATVKFVDVIVDVLGEPEGLRSLLTYVMAIGATLLLNWSLFDGFGTAIRDRTLGVWVTGFMVAGATSAWRAMFGYLTHDRATVDEPLGMHRGLERVA